MNNDTLKTVLAFAGGAIAGAAVGILLAPDKGSETRKRILTKAKDMGSDLSDAAMEKYDEFLEWKNSLMNEAEASVKKAGSQVKEAVNEHLGKAGSGVRNAVENGLDKAESKIKTSQG